MTQNVKKHACWECNFSTSRKFNLDRHFKRKHQNQHQRAVQAQQPWARQPGGKIKILHQQQYGNHGQINNQPQYRNVKLFDLELLKTCANIEYLLQNVDHCLGCFPLDR